MEGVNYKSIWKYFKIQENFDMCKKCEKILLGEEDLSLRKHLSLYHQINVFDDGKVPASTIPFLHDHFRFGMMATCDYCRETEYYLELLNKLITHLIRFHKESHLLTEKVYKILTFSKIKCVRCCLLNFHLHRMHSSLMIHSVRHPEELLYE